MIYSSDSIVIIHLTTRCFSGKNEIASHSKESPKSESQPQDIITSVTGHLHWEREEWIPHGSNTLPVTEKMTVTHKSAACALIVGRQRDLQKELSSTNMFEKMESKHMESTNT